MAEAVCALGRKGPVNRRKGFTFFDTQVRDPFEQVHPSPLGESLVGAVLRVPLLRSDLIELTSTAYRGSSERQSTPLRKSPARSRR